MNIITSKDNENIKEIKKLLTKKYRDEKNQFIIEGIKLIKEAIQEKVEIKKIFICENCLKEGTFDKDVLYEIAKYNCLYVSEKIFSSLSSVNTPQGILAVVEKNDKINEINYNQDIIVVLDDIQDPGNLGTILRTLDSANINQIIISNNTADPYNPKVVRSTMGAIFRINIIRVDNLLTVIKDIKKNKYRVVTTSLKAETNMYDVEFNRKAIVIGNEAKGVSEDVINESDETIKIPMLGKTESLNASVATGVIIYEYVRQKISKLQ